MRRSTLAVLLLLAGVFGCESDDPIIGERVPNTPPDTDVGGAPPLLSETSFEVTFAWNGWDLDGEVIGYEWRISNNGMDGVVDIEDTLEVDLPWQFTTATDSTFVVSADLDSFAVDVDDPQQNDPRSFRYWQTHTFFVRAIDNRGAVDRSPASVSFTATTLAPRIEIREPRTPRTISCVLVSRVVSFGWFAVDPDGGQDSPLEVRSLLLKVGADSQSCLTRAHYEQQQPIRHDDPSWSAWVPYDPERGLGAEVTTPRQDTGAYLFAVQARDAAGAVTPTFEWNRNVRHIVISNSKFPQIVVAERFLGQTSFVSTGGFLSFEIVTGQPLEFNWGADASSYGGTIEAFRYGWNLQDPDNPDDPGWTVGWGNGREWQRATPRSFTQGSPNFVVQCRDNSGTISRVFYQFQVNQVTERANQRNLLLVNDWGSAGSEIEEELFTFFDTQWAQILGDDIDGFQAGDRIEAFEGRLSFRTVSDYRSVIWFTNSSDATFFHTRLAPINQIQSRYNWLEVYQARVGNVLFAGPGAAFNSVERESWIFPILFDTTAQPPAGFGVRVSPDGSVERLGNSRWPYQGWCVESVDIVRPSPGFLWGEQLGPGSQLRSVRCDGLAVAEASEEFFQEFPDAAFEVRDLQPTSTRRELEVFNYAVEEFYNVNSTQRPYIVRPRDCQVPMFLLRARRDEGFIADPDRECPPDDEGRSPLDGGVVGVASRRYADTKQLRGSEDFLWGFNPMTFEPADVGAAVKWIMRSRWELAVR